MKTQWRRAKTSLKKYTSHFIERVRKGLLKVLLWEEVGDRTELQYIDPTPLLWPSALCLSRSPGLFNRRPSLLDAGFLYRILSPTGLQTPWLPVFIELYNSSIAHLVSLEWHVWFSSSGNNCHAVHRSLSSSASVYDCTLGF